MIQEAKKQSWKLLCTKITRNPFNIAYKLARTQIKQKIILPSIKKGDGIMTKSLEETRIFAREVLPITERTRRSCRS